MKVTSIKCPNCGANTNIDEDRGFGYCSYCGSKLVSGEHVHVHVNVNHEYEKPPEQNNNYTYVTNNYYTNEAPGKNWDAVSDKSRTAAILLCIFFGLIGAHHFYVGRIGLGILYLLTAGLFCIGWIVDFIKIISGSFTDGKGLEVRNW